MATELKLYGRTVESVFDLLGTKENDLTYALGFTLSRSRAFLESFLLATSGCELGSESAVIRLQGSEDIKGFTDLEIETKRLHLIIEAKRGRAGPRSGQLEKYLPRFCDTKRACQYLIVSDAVNDYFRHGIQPNMVPIEPTTSFVSWSDVHSVAKTISPTEPYLSEFCQYLFRYVVAREREANMVYIVSIGNYMVLGSERTPREIVLNRQYFHPFGTGRGKKWPKEPLQMIGFRWGGRLQGVFPVISYEIVEDLRDLYHDFTKSGDATHIVYQLGEPIFENEEMRTGKTIVRSNRVWVHIDDLRTSSTISEALIKTQARKPDYVSP